MPPRTLVIIPAFNEQDALPGVLAELAVKAPEHDVLVVSDGSTDGTAAVARAAGAVVAELPFNLGVGGALRTGFLYAARNGYDRAVQIDGDGQHEPSEIPKLLDALDRGAQLVIGSRFASVETPYRVSRLRSSAMRLLRLAVKLLSGRIFSDTSSGFRGFARPTIEFFAGTYPIEYMGDSVEALLMACYAGFEVVEVPAAMRARAGGTPSHRHTGLVYHYVRLLIMIATTASLRGRRLRQVAT